ncbi:imidazolonepropionase [Burkholderia sp. OAS925]
MKQTVWHQLKLCPQGDPDHTLPDAAIAVEHGTIAWLGASADLPAQYAAWPREELHGAWVTPGLVDCHTHLVYGGQRADEFAQRLAGVSYEEIARQGGGIVSTVRATRAASEDALFNQSAARLEPLLAEGLTAIEIKSGYGLDLDSERKMLRVARQLGERYPVTVYTTFLGAHALPPEFAGRADAYIDEVCNTMLPALADEGLVDAVDVFCERIGFSLEQSERVFNAAARYKLPVKMHAEQLSNGGGTALAARHRALSADHLEFLDEAGVAAMKEAGTVAVLLPGAYYFIRETQLPPLDLLRRYEVPIAISTDSNPGHIARHVVAADDEHGDDAIPHDRARSAEGRDIECGARARQGGPSWFARSRARCRLRGVVGRLARGACLLDRASAVLAGRACRRDGLCRAFACF